MRTTLLPIIIMLAAGSAASGAVTINEVRTGAGNAQYVEFKGTPGESMAGMTFLIIGDGTTGGATPTKSGVVEWRWTFDASAVIGSNGYLVLHNPGQNPALPADTSGAFPFTVDPNSTNIPWTYQTSGLAVDTQFERADNQTFMLVSGYSGTDTFVTRAPGGTAGQDLDTNDDGNLDTTPWKSIVDQLAMKETNGNSPSITQDWWYAPIAAGPSISRQVVVPVVDATIAGWDFQTTINDNHGTAAAKLPNTPTVFNSNAGIGTMYLDGTNGSSAWLQSGELDALQGTNLNATGSAGNGLDPAISSTSGLVLQSSAANGKAVVFRFSMSGLTGLKISYATRGSGTSGFNTHTWDYSNDGVTWAAIPGGTVTGLTTSFAVKSFPTLNAVDGYPEVYIRCTVTGATTLVGNNRIDNVVFAYSQVLPPTVQSTYAAPSQAFKRADGAWVVGNPSTVAGTALDTVGSDNPPYMFACGDAGAGDSLTAHWNPTSSDTCCCTWVCQNDEFCCSVSWDSICATAATGCAGQCANACPADIDGDFAVSASDLAILLSSWGTTGPGDLNQSGTVDASDIAMLLGAWGACP